MRLTLSTKVSKPAPKSRDTGWIVEELDTSDARFIEIVSGGELAPWAHTLLTFHGGHRLAKNLHLRSGIFMDFDEGTTRQQIHDAIPIGCGYVLAPSRNHLKAKGDKPACERWHAYIPFFEAVPSGERLELAVANFIARHFGALGADPLFDAGRMFFPGNQPENTVVFEGGVIHADALVRDYAAGTDAADYKILVADKRREARGEAPRAASPARKGTSVPKQQKGGEYWRRKQEVTLADGRTVMASEITEKTPCHCINPEHADSTPSAFVAFNEEELQFISCSTCNLTWWEKDWIQPYLDRLFYVDAELHAFYGDAETSWDVGKFPQNGIIAPTPEAKTGLLAMLAKTPLCKSKLVIQREKAGNGEPAATKDTARSVLHLGEPMRPASAKYAPDEWNHVVEEWFSAMFGEHAEFLMNWASIFAHTNYIRLPVLVFNGPRGSGKSGFGEMLGSLYPNRSRRWDADKTGFNDELDSVFVLVEELAAAEHGHNESKAFYRQLKSLMGGRNIAINRKFGLKYEVRNNVNMVIITNDLDPIHLNPFEQATDPANNQFFIHTMQKTVEIDLIKWRRVQACFPGWVRTAGYARVMAWDAGEERHKARYGLLCPITEHEDQAYEESKTEIERLAPGLWRGLLRGAYRGSTLIGVDRIKGYFTAEDFKVLAGALDSGHSGLHLCKLFRRYGWIGPSRLYRSGSSVVRGYPIEVSGRLAADETDPDNHEV